MEDSEMNEEFVFIFRSFPVKFSCQYPLFRN